MKDRVYLVLGFFGFVIIALVVYFNYHGRFNTEYNIESSFMPIQRNDLMSSYELYQQLTGARALSCPEVATTVCKDTVPLGSIWGSYYNHNYKANYLFVPRSVISDTGITPMIDNYKDQLRLSDKAGTSDTVLLSELFTVDIFENNTYVQIIAPFSYSFENVNSSYSIDKSTGKVTQNIVIINSEGTCKITFGNVANWFCAGTPGTQTVVGTNSDGVKSWEDHYSAHHSIVGNSANAVVRGGNAGEIIGYANRDTTISIDSVGLSGNKRISLYDFILPSN